MRVGAYIIAFFTAEKSNWQEVYEKTKEEK